MQRRRFYQDREDGVALIIVLAFLVILTGLVVAYVSRTASDRQLAHATFSEGRADQLARSGLDIVVADLKQEIATGSTVSTISGYTIYTPSSSANVLPIPDGAPSDKSIPNLLKRSYRSDNPLSPAIGSRASAVNSNTDPSSNNRSVSSARWNKHYLIPRNPTVYGNSPNTVGTEPLSSFSAPDWVLVTRNGPAAFSGWNATVADATSTNTNFVVGRYAYTVYDEGGLLDVNVAGFPIPSLPPLDYEQVVGRKGSLAYAELRSLPSPSPSATVPDARVNQIVGWRNYASTQPSGSITSAAPYYTFSTANAQAYMNFIANPTPTATPRDFLTTASTMYSGSTDQAFTSRQQLLAFRTATGDIGFSQNYLQYFGTFSRELNRPSWKPATSSTINPDLQSVRVSGTFIRADGTQAVVGEALMKQRFALTRLSGLSSTGIVTTGNSTLLNGFLSPATSATVQRDFGLQWDGTNLHWNYTGSTGSGVQSSIKTLSQVASENREPNFFEVLKAMILNGSVGLGSNASTFVASESKYYDTSGGLSSDYQIMQIGANIVDEWDPDNLPTFINFGGSELAGVENLPYLSKLIFDFWISKNGNQGAHDQMYAWLVPSLWNPHQNASDASKATGDVRFAMTSGSASAVITFSDFPTISSSPIPSPSPATPYPYIEVKASGFANAFPPVPSPAPSIAPSNENGSPPKIGNVTLTKPPRDELGLYDALDLGNPTDLFRNNAYKKVTGVYPVFGANTDFEMQVNINGTWKAYQKWKAVNNGTQAAPLVFSYAGNNYGNTSFEDPEFVSLDPRTVRFGVWASEAKNTADAANTKSWIGGAEDTSDQRTSSGGFEITSTSLRPQPTTTFLMSSPRGLGYLYAANTSGTDYYKDLDGVQRRGDWTTDLPSTTSTKTIMFTGPTPSATPTPTPTPTASPTPTATPAPSPPSGTYRDRSQVISGRFQSVGELGHVFRDQPWKTLSFSTSASADAGLLDAFTLQDAFMTAGRVSLNTRQLPVLTAILKEAIQNIASLPIAGKTQSTVELLAPDVGQIISALTTLTNTGPMVNKGELVTRLMENSSLTCTTCLWSNSNNTGNDPFNKESREAVIRALCDTTQTRTWNLMIDVIAQSGRYPPNATSLANFVVEGEKRYWLHVAIDRFTGEVIDQQLEAVYE